MASASQWTRTLAKSRRLWVTEKPGMLHSMGLQRVRDNLATEQQQIHWFFKNFWYYYCLDTCLWSNHFHSYIAVFLFVSVPQFIFTLFSKEYSSMIFSFRNWGDLAEFLSSLSKATETIKIWAPTLYWVFLPICKDLLGGILSVMPYSQMKIEHVLDIFSRGSLSSSSKLAHTSFLTCRFSFIYVSKTNMVEGSILMILAGEISNEVSPGPSTKTLASR